MVNTSVCDRPKHVRQTFERKRLFSKYKEYNRQLKIELLNKTSNDLDCSENSNQIRFYQRKLRNIEKLLA